ncbi:DNA methyltransferase [Planctomicrobium piriforme]|uniref:Site-specific DNA-methyltransferase (Adenine-specific) n=1 Tax=Planctomicrobium piriforme TaxID=1576369 RepID=A0A1I3TIU6_9PLAN|nr:DNA methyltransferase [Planctomicrobium piriforme]SFJ69551.1 site-specific DNA-methyltransferase (adenine-specific) [Planctomicrobium piriforme]
MNTIRHGDCIREMNRLKAGSVDLVFADPPFNIGFEYDVYSDSLPFTKYLDWSSQWIKAVHRVLKSNGTFWLAIGDEYAAELKVESQKIGFHCRSWVIWYYTFGVNCSRKFTRSHAHLFHFVKDPNDFVFLADDPENRIPSARQLVYNDSRANPKGRLPDDTWIIRPQDLEDRLQPNEDTWYFPRVAGTFKERAGFHGCQMPEQLLGRIIRTCSEKEAVVLDPFSGSATTAAVAKKLGRKYLGFDLSEEYVKLGTRRLDSIRVGDPLDGSPEPNMSAPKTGRSSVVPGKRSRRQDVVQANSDERMQLAAERQQQLTMEGVLKAFEATHAGYSADRMVADPTLNVQFTDACRELGLMGEPRSWNTLLFRLRKAGKLSTFATTERTALDWKDCDPFLFASEIAWGMLLDEEKAASLDEILGDPILAAEFDGIARRFAPGFDSLHYRWAALKLRKQSHQSKTRAESICLPQKLGKSLSVVDFDPESAPNGSGVYVLGSKKHRKLYVGQAIHLRDRLAGQFAHDRRELWLGYADQHQIKPKDFGIWIRPLQQARPGETMAWQKRLVQEYQPVFNPDLGS